MPSSTKIPILDLKLADEPNHRGLLLDQLRDAFFNIGFLYIKNHGVPEETIHGLADKLPALFNLPAHRKKELSKTESPQFLGFSDFAEETTMGKTDLRQTYDIATELPEIYQKDATPDERGRDFSQLFWRLRGPNVWPTEDEIPGFKKAANDLLNAYSELSYRFVHLVEEAFGIPVGTFDSFFTKKSKSPEVTSSPSADFLPPQNRMRLLHYPAIPPEQQGQGLGAHKDIGGWLTFLHQVGTQSALEVQDRDGTWVPAVPIPGTLVVNLGYPFEAATEGAARATVHRVRAPEKEDRYSLPFFMGLPFELKLLDIKAAIPEEVKAMRKEWVMDQKLESFWDPRWDCIGESLLKRFIGGFKGTAIKHYGQEVYQYYTQ